MNGFWQVMERVRPVLPGLTVLLDQNGQVWEMAEHCST